MSTNHSVEKESPAKEKKIGEKSRKQDEKTKTIITVEEKREHADGKRPSSAYP